MAFADVHQLISQERKKIQDAYVAKLYPHPVLRPECLRTQSNPDPPTLWYGFPVNPEIYHGYIVKKGNPDGLDVNEDAHLLVMPALKILWEVFKTKRICDVLPLCPYSDELYRMIGFKCSLWPSSHNPITKADERMAAMLREELGLPKDRPCLWHFAYATADKAVAVRLLAFPYPKLTTDSCGETVVCILRLLACASNMGRPSGLRD